MKTALVKILTGVVVYVLTFGVLLNWVGDVSTAHQYRTRTRHLHRICNHQGIREPNRQEHFGRDAGSARVTNE